MNREERLTALKDFFKMQGTGGISLIEVQPLVQKWGFKPNLLRKDIKELTETGVLILKGGKFYHSAVLEKFLEVEECTPEGLFSSLY